MKNADIRTRALSKMKSKIANLSAFVVIVFVVQRALGLMGGITGTALNIALGVIVHIVTALLTAGLSKVAIQSWREGAARWSDVVICFRDRRYLLCGLYGGMLAALLGLAGDLAYIFGNAIVGYIAEALTGWAAAVCTGYIVFAADIFEKDAPLDAAKRGMRTLMGNMARIMQMEINLYWWIVAAMVAIFLFCGVLGGVGAIPLRFILFVAMGILKWAIGGYIALCEAGLARTLMKN